MRVFITGISGLLGSTMAKYLINNGHEVVGIDNINDYYDINLKKDRLKQIPEHNFSFLQQDCPINQQVANYAAVEINIDAKVTLQGIDSTSFARRTADSLFGTTEN